MRFPGNNNFHATEETMETIAAMCRQEEKVYRTEDYLSTIGTADSSACSCESSEVDTSPDCRSKMAHWCFQVVDFLKFRRETVAIAMNILDRYMLSASGQVHAKPQRKIYQLAAMTCLYTAIKIHEPEAISPDMVAKLSQGTYTIDEVEAMEREILQAVGWYVNPPTAMSFARHLLDIIAGSAAMKDATKQHVLVLAEIQTEAAVKEYEFLAVAPSVIGYCSLMNALECVGARPETLSSISYVLAKVIRVSMDQQQVGEIQDWLYQAVDRTHILHNKKRGNTHCSYQQPTSSSLSSSSLHKSDMVGQLSYKVSPCSVTVAPSI